MIEIDLDNIDMNDLTLDELDTIETVCGVTLDQLGQPGQPQAKMIKAIVWVLARRQNPELTLDEVGELRLGDLNLTQGDLADPKA